MQTEPGPPPLLAYAEMAWRRRLLVLVIAVGMAGAAYAASVQQQPMYATSAQLLLSQLEVDGNLNIARLSLSEQELNTQEAILSGTEVRGRAAELGATSEIDASVETNSNIISIAAVDPVPARAAATLNAYARAYSEYRLVRSRETIGRAADQLELRVDLLQQQVDSPDTVEVGGLVSQQANLQEKLSQLDIQLGLAESNVELLRQPLVPTSPISPTPVRDTGVALALGLAVGATLAVLLETPRRQSRRDVSEQVTSKATAEAHGEYRSAPATTAETTGPVGEGSAEYPRWESSSARSGEGAAGVSSYHGPP